MELVQDEFTKFLLNYAVDPELAQRALRVLWPVRQKAQLGDRDRSMIEIVGETISDAIRKATDCPVSSLSLFTVERGEPANFDTRVSWHNSLPAILLDRYWSRFTRRFADCFGRNKSFENFRDNLWHFLQADVTQPLGLAFWNDSFAAPKVGPGDSIGTTLFYYATAAVVDDADAVADLEGLVKLLLHQVPIGRNDGDRELWFGALLLP